MTLCRQHWKFHGECTDRDSPWLPWVILGLCIGLLISWLVIAGKPT